MWIYFTFYAAPVEVIFSTPYTCLVFLMATANVLCHYNRQLMGNFKFLDDWKMLSFKYPLNISGKFH